MQCNREGWGYGEKGKYLYECINVCVLFKKKYRSNICSKDALAFKYWVWPGEVDILKYTEGWRISLGTGDYVQALDPVFGDLHDFSRLDFTVIPVEQRHRKCPPAVPCVASVQSDTVKSLTWRQWTGSCRTPRRRPSLLCLLLHLLRNTESE